MSVHLASGKSAGDTVESRDNPLPLYAVRRYTLRNGIG